MTLPIGALFQRTKRGKIDGKEGRNEWEGKERRVVEEKRLEFDWKL